MSIEKVNNFLSEAKIYYLTTVNGDKPKCRPIGLNILDDGKIYFGVGDFKEVYKQMQVNPNVEICATIGGKFLRYYGKAVFETNDKIANQAIEILPMLKNIYNEETGHKMAMFHLEESTADFYSMLKVEESFKF